MATFLVLRGRWHLERLRRHVDWHTDLNDPVVRDYVDGERFAELMAEKGISRDSTVVFYGDNFNWWAAYALWVFTLFGHEDVRLLDGGRQKWIAEERQMTTDATVRPAADYPQEGVLRGGHVAGAASVPWKRAASDDGTFKPRADLAAIYEGEIGLASGDDVVVYCRIGERSSHTWFVLTRLLGFENVRNYDGSWTEWGNVVGVPIERP